MPGKPPARTAKYIPLDWSGAAGMMATLREEHERGEHKGRAGLGGHCLVFEGSVRCPGDEVITNFTPITFENPRANLPAGERRAQVGRRKSATRRR